LKNNATNLSIRRLTVSLKRSQVTDFHLLGQICNEIAPEKCVGVISVPGLRRAGYYGYMILIVTQNTNTMV